MKLSTVKLWTTIMQGFSVAAVLVVASCGGGDGTGSCGKVAACGGDVVGTWKLSEGCYDSVAFNSDISAGLDCPTATTKLSNLRFSGTLTFSTGGTYTTTNVAESFDMSLTVPAACLTSSTDCEKLDQRFKDQLTSGSGFVSTQCAMAGTSCSCSLAANTTITETGTYTIAGTMLTASGKLSGGDYCVADKNLHFLEVDTTMNMGPMGTATIKSDIVATKQ